MRSTEDQPFVRSSFCSLGACVEVATLAEGGVALRDSRSPDLLLTFTEVEWLAFIDGVKAGEFDPQ